MHTHTIQTKYTFGDRVRYSSHLNGSGEGTVAAISFMQEGHPCYYIELEDATWQGGITDADITPLDPEADPATVVQ